MNLRKFIFKFDPREKGLKKVLGDLEAAIMEAVWMRDRVTVRDIYETLRQQRKLAYTTVMTVMSRLADKGLLDKEKQGHTFVYRAATTRDEFTRGTIGKILGELLDDFGSPVLSHFVETVGREDPQKMEELAKLIELKKREQNE